VIGGWLVSRDLQADAIVAGGVNVDYGGYQPQGERERPDHGEIAPSRPVAQSWESAELVAGCFAEYLGLVWIDPRERKAA
jgi:hypothetical protein